MFSINPEYLIGNSKNHILSDEVIKEILIYIRDNVKDRTPFTNADMIDKLIDNPHSLIDIGTYKSFVQNLFYASIVEELKMTYSQEDKMPLAFNMLHYERKHQKTILARIDEYKSWVDKFIWNEIEHPLNDSGLDDTIYDNIQILKNQKKISSKFSPFAVADSIYFSGLSPTHGLSEDELSLVEQVLSYHAKPRYDYENQGFVSDMSTQYSYYKELEFCEYVKLVMFVMNNIGSFRMEGLTYDITSNKFI